MDGSVVISRTHLKLYARFYNHNICLILSLYLLCRIHQGNVYHHTKFRLCELFRRRAVKHANKENIAKLKIHAYNGIRTYNLLNLTLYISGDADSSQVPGLTSGLQGSVNVYRGALLLVPQ